MCVRICACPCVCACAHFVCICFVVVVVLYVCACVLVSGISLVDESLEEVAAPTGQSGSQELVQGVQFAYTVPSQQASDTHDVSDILTVHPKICK